MQKIINMNDFFKHLAFNKLFQNFLSCSLSCIFEVKTYLGAPYSFSWVVNKAHPSRLRLKREICGKPR